MTFAEHLRYLRGDLTQTAFCRRLGIPLTTYQRYEKGERVPDITLLAQIVRCVGISADILLGLDSLHDANGTPADRGQSSYSPHLNKKDAIIANQQETIANLTHAIQALS